MIKKLIVKFLLIVIVIYTAIGCGASYYYKKGQLAFEQKNFSEALINYKTVLDLDNSYPNISLKIEFTEFCIAKKENTVPAFKNFIQKFPQGHYCYESKRIVDNKLFETAQKENTIEAYKNYQKNTFLKNDKKGHWKNALNLINRIRLRKANDANSVKNYHSALLLYTDILKADPVYPSIKVFIERTEFYIAKEENTIKEWQLFLNKYPDNAYSNDAKKELEGLLFQEAKTKNTLQDYKRYFLLTPFVQNDHDLIILNLMYKQGMRFLYAQKCELALNFFENMKNIRYNYPYLQSRIHLTKACLNNSDKKRIVDSIKVYIHGEQALAHKKYNEAISYFKIIEDDRLFLPEKLSDYIEKAEYYVAKQTFTEKALKDYKKKYPSGKYVEEVDEQLDLLMEKNQFLKAQKSGSLSAYSQFIGEYPNSIYIKYAKNDITKLIDLHEKRDFEIAKKRGSKGLKSFIKKYEPYSYAKYITPAREIIRSIRYDEEEMKRKAKSEYNSINKKAKEAQKLAMNSVGQKKDERNKAVSELSKVITRINNFNINYSISEYNKKLFTLSAELKALYYKINTDPESYFIKKDVQ